MNGTNFSNINYSLHPELCGDNPMINTIKKFGKSSVLLVAIIVYGANLILSIMQPILANEGNTKVYKVNTIIGQIVPALVFIGFLMFYLSCRTNKYPGVKPTGIQIVYYTEFVVSIIIYIAIFFILIGLIVVASSGKDIAEFINKYSDYYNFEKFEVNEIGSFLLTVLIVVITLLAALVVLFFIFLLKGLKRVIKTIKCGVFCGKIPVGLAVLLIIMAAFTVINILSMDFDAFSYLINILDAAAYILFALCLFRYNNEMEALWYVTEGGSLSNK